MKVLDAVAALLEDIGQPLHYGEITRLILERGLWQSEGLTPDATINARLAVDIKQHGAASRFQRTAPGIFALRAWGLPEAPARGKARKEDAVEEQPAPAAAPVPPVESSSASSPRPARTTLSFTDAAEYVLERYGDRKPMHYRAITDKILDLGLVQTQGKTPEATLYAQILTEIKRTSQRGDSPRFVKHGKGLLGLTEWLGDGLGRQIRTHNQSVRKALRQHLLQMDPGDFEALIGRLLVALGFEDVVVTHYSGDQGIDVRATLVVGDVVRTRMAIQVKRWKSNVQAPVVQQVRGSLSTHDQGLIITTSDFSKGARSEAAQPDKIPVALMNGEQLVTLLVENEIGVARTPHHLLELMEEEADE